MLKEFFRGRQNCGNTRHQGRVRVDPWCDSPDFLAQFKTLYTKDGAQALEVISSRVHKKFTFGTVKRN